LDGAFVPRVESASVCDCRDDLDAFLAIAANETGDAHSDDAAFFSVATF
jgi:hypothetical protein